MNLSWLAPELLEQVSQALRRGVSSWDELFDGDGVRTGARPPGVAVEDWPRIAAHVARAERVRQVLKEAGAEEAGRRFGASPHAVERGALIEGGTQDLSAVTGLLACEIDAYVAYGQFLSRLVDLGLPRDPEGTVAAFERFVAAAAAAEADLPSWPERVRVARDGLAALYVRAGRPGDADALYLARFLEEPEDTTIAIGAGRAFLEAGDTSRAVAWLERAADRARDIGRGELEARLREKVVTLKTRAN